MRRIVIVLTALALVACGNGTGNAEPVLDSSSTTSLRATTTTTGATSTTAAPVVTTTQAPMTTTTTAAPVTTSVSPTTTSQPSTTIVVAPYFYIDEDGHLDRSGPFVVPIAREVPSTTAVARASLEQLFAGPTSDELESIPAISTAIPSGVRVLGLTIDGNVATVDLSSEFGATDISATVAQRGAQVVFTLTRYDSVGEVLFRQDGEPVSIQIGDGSLVSRPVGIWDYLEFAAAIAVESPVYRGVGGNPLRVSGFGAVFEATFQYALADDDGLIIAEGIAMTNNGVGWGGFDFTIDYEVDHRQVGALIVWANSAKDGSQIDIREYPVALVP